MSDKIKNWVCLGCECLCDDLVANVAAPLGATQVSGGCTKADSWLARPGIESAEVNGQAVTYDEAIDAARELLAHAKTPLITQLGNLTTEAQRAAVSVAESTSAFMDTTLSIGGRSTLAALQSTGLVTGTLGEVRDRSELVLFWFCDPTQSHPRFIEKFVSQQAKIVAIGPQFESPTHLSLTVPTDKAYPTVREMTDWLIGINETENRNQPTQCSDALKEILAQIKQTKHTTVIYQETANAIEPTTDSTNPGDTQFDIATAMLLRWIQKLNDITRAIGVGLRTDQNAQSMENVLAWQTGAPHCVRFLNGVAQHDPEFRSSQLVRNHACDLVLFSMPDQVPESLRPQLKTLKTVCLVHDQKDLENARKLSCDVIVPLAQPGISSSGSWCRMDDISLPLRPYLQSNWPSDIEFFSSGVSLNREC